MPDDPGGWNSPYWRDLGSPWGGAHGTAADVVRWLRFFADPIDSRPAAPRDGARDADPVGAGIKSSTGPAPGGATATGLGFRLGLGGKGCSEQTFGHGGATGCLAWMDPDPRPDLRAAHHLALTPSPSRRS